jgi:hypothetical protein
LAIDLNRNLGADEYIVVSHPYLRRSVTDPTILNDQLVLDATSKSSFQALWRPHDEASALQLVSTQVEENAALGGYVTTYTDISMHKVNLTLPSMGIKNVPIITSSVPRILSLVVNEGSPSLICGDKLIFILT